MADEDQAYLDELQRQRAEEERLARLRETSVPPLDPGVTAASRASDYTQRGLPTVSEASPAATPLEGPPLNQREQAFWAANPNGAVVDYSTGALIGLGDKQPGGQYSDSGPVSVNAGLGPPATPYSQQARINEGVGPPAFAAQQQQQARTPQQFTVNDFINPMISARMGQLENERAIIARNLNSLSPVAPGRGQKSPRELELQKLKLIDHSYGVLQREQHNQSSLAFRTTTENQKLQRETEHTNAGTEIARWVNTLPRDPAARQQAWQQELAKPERGNWLDAITNNPGVRQYTQEALKSHQTVAEQQAALQAMAGGRQVELTGGSEKSPRFKVQPTFEEGTAKETQKKVQKDFANAGVTPEQFAQRTEVVGVDKDGKQVEDGTHVKVKMGDIHFIMPKETYTRLNTAVPAIQPNPAAQGQPAATPDPRIELAQRALADPNSSEIHKAAARKLLGIQ